MPTDLRRRAQNMGWGDLAEFKRLYHDHALAVRQNRPTDIRRHQQRIDTAWKRFLKEEAPHGD